MFEGDNYCPREDDFLNFKVIAKSPLPHFNPTLIGPLGTLQMKLRTDSSEPYYVQVCYMSSKQIYSFTEGVCPT